jgi:hypothetical protein
MNSSQHCLVHPLLMHHLGIVEPNAMITIESFLTLSQLSNASSVSISAISTPSIASEKQFNLFLAAVERYFMSQVRYLFVGMVIHIKLEEDKSDIAFFKVTDIQTSNGTLSESEFAIYRSKEGSLTQEGIINQQLPCNVLQYLYQGIVFSYLTTKMIEK